MNINTNYSTHFENQLIRETPKKTKIKTMEIVFVDSTHKRVKEIKAQIWK